jgi:antitoxin ParD1/3/4
MNVTITPDLRRLIEERVKAGPYGSANEVLREALRLLAEHDELAALRRQELRKKVAEGLAASRRGDVVDGEAAFRRLRARSARRRRA